MVAVLSRLATPYGYVLRVAQVYHELYRVYRVGAPVLVELKAEVGVPCPDVRQSVVIVAPAIALQYQHVVLVHLPDRLHQTLVVVPYYGIVAFVAPIGIVTLECPVGLVDEVVACNVRFIGIPFCQPYPQSLQLVHIVVTLPE